MAKPRGNFIVRAAKDGRLANCSITKATNRQLYADAIRRKDSNMGDRLSEPLDSDSADLGKGMEERVGMANLINVNSSVSGGATTSRDINPGPCCCEMGSSSDNRVKVSETEDNSLGHGGAGGFQLGLWWEVLRKWVQLKDLVGLAFFHNWARQVWVLAILLVRPL
ncbi:hypothetical protein Ancab_022988 [Ancistrocladus abbreviatus]